MKPHSDKSADKPGSQPSGKGASSDGPSDFVVGSVLFIIFLVFMTLWMLYRLPD